MYAEPVEFKRGDPTGITKKLRLVLEKAERHCVPIEWEMFGPEAIANLSRRDSRIRDLRKR